MFKSESEQELITKKYIKFIERDLGSCPAETFKTLLLNLLAYKFMTEIYTNADDEKRVKLGYKIDESDYFENILENLKNDDFVKFNLNKTLIKLREASKIPELFTPLISLKKSTLGNLEESNEKITKTMENINNFYNELSKLDSVDFGEVWQIISREFYKNSGRGGGEYYTPKCVSDLINSILKIYNKNYKTCYDPTSGSNSLLINFKKENPTARIFGQEINTDSHYMGLLNIVCNNINYNDFDTQEGDTLKNPKHLDKTFDAVVANPPFSLRINSDELFEFERFKKLKSETKKTTVADSFFILHILNSLNSEGVAVFLISNAFLRKNCTTERKARKIILKYLDAVIQLPANLFINTPVAPCVIILNKNKKDDVVKFINAFDLFENKKIKGKKLTSNNINQICNVLQDKEITTNNITCSQVDFFEIMENNYNLYPSYFFKKLKASKNINDKDFNKIQQIFKKSETKKFVDVTKWGTKFKDVDNINLLNPRMKQARRHQITNVQEIKTGDVEIVGISKNFKTTQEECKKNNLTIYNLDVAFFVPKGGAKYTVKYNEGNFIPVNQFVGCSIDENLIKTKYLQIILNCLLSNKTFLKGATNLQHVDFVELLDVRVPIPTIEQQSEIIQIFLRKEEELEKLENELKTKKETTQEIKENLL